MGEPTDEEFKRSVSYFYTERGDPTRYCSWDAERCQRLMPDFYLAWSQARSYERLADLAIREATNDLEP